MLRTPHNEIFAAGRAKYQFRPHIPGRINERIFIDIEIEGVQTTAALDTGGLYLVLNPAFASGIDLRPENGLLEVTEQGTKKPTLNMRGQDFIGVYHRISLGFPAYEGQGCQIEATVFVPDPEQQAMWDSLELPNFLGFFGCMERLRFAIDPINELFYFGADLLGN